MILTSEDVYARLPYPLKRFALTIEYERIRKRRFGREFEAALRLASAQATSSPRAINDANQERLRAFLWHAVETFPYWSERVAETGVSIDEIVAHQLAPLPIMHKEDARQFSTTINQSAGDWAHTSGSTGAGLRFPVDSAGAAAQWAVWWRHWMAHGIRREEPRAILAGRRVVPGNRDRVAVPLLGRRGLYLSAYHLSEDNAEAYANSLRDAGVRWLHGYPSAVARLAHLLRDAGIRQNLRWVTLGGENVTSAQRQVIEEVFGCECIEHYGLAEATANASRCSHGRYHFDEDFAPVELVAVGPSDDRHRIVGSNITNPAFPLIRYDSGDIASGIEDAACECGREGRLVNEVDGRLEDEVVSFRGARVGRLDHIFKDLDWIAEAQILQQRQGVIEVLVVPSDGTDREPATWVLDREVRRYLGSEFSWTIRYVNSIRRDSSGKIRFVKSTCKPPRETTNPSRQSSAAKPFEPQGDLGQ